MSFLGNKWPVNRLGGYAAIPYIIEAVAAAGSAVEQKQVSARQAEAASNAADYNAKLDVSQATQLSMDANANIQKQRQEAQVYESNQRAALAASGVLSDTGSPMALQATTAGREEQNIQTYWTSVQQKESELYGSAEEGAYQGSEQADIYHLQGAADIFQGVGSITGDLGKGYQTYQGGNG
jgi:hypothetical protein